ncbi:flagellar basal body L-ring protein FlgH [bacterium]|nr:flagellar basal body L-ring protein FlgH [bacterium]
MKKLLITFLLCGIGRADSLLDPNQADMYAMRPLQVGELVTVVITDSVSTTQSVNIQNQNSSAVSLPLGTGLLDALLGGKMSSDGKIQKQDQAASKSEFTNTVTAKVVSIEAGNVVVIQAHSVMEMDGKERELELNGRVRRQDIGFDNRVSSDRIADAVVKVDGATAAAGRSGFGIFDFLLAPFR